MKKHQTAVLAIGSSKVTVAVGVRSVNNTYNILARSDARYDGFTGGEFVEPSGVAPAIAAVLKQVESVTGKISKIFVGVPTDFAGIAVREVEASYKKPKTISASDVAVLLDGGNIYGDSEEYEVINRSALKFSLSDREIFDAVGTRTDKLSATVSYIMADGGFLSLVGGCLRELGVQEIVYLSAALSTYLYLAPLKSREKPVIMVDVGHISGSVVCAVGNGIKAMQSFWGGGGVITLDLAKGLNISFDQAEELKRNLLITLEPDPNELFLLSDGTAVQWFAAKEIMTDSLYYLAETIQSGIADCGVAEHDNMPLMLTGGGLGYIRGARDVLERVTGRVVELVAPPLPLLGRKPDMSELYALIDTAAAQELD